MIDQMIDIVIVVSNVRKIHSIEAQSVRAMTIHKILNKDIIVVS